LPVGRLWWPISLLVGSNLSGEFAAVFFSDLRVIEEVLGLPEPGRAGSATTETSPASSPG
jgi:hypothetical protein